MTRLLSDPQMHICLIALRATGSYDIYTIIQSGSAWICQGPISMEGGISRPLPRGSFVIDSKSGRQWPADRTRFNAAISNSSPGKGLTPTPGILVMVGERGAKCVAGINGERIGKVEWGNKLGTIQAAQIIEKMGMYMLYVMLMWSSFLNTFE